MHSFQDLDNQVSLATPFSVVVCLSDATASRLDMCIEVQPSRFSLSHLNSC